MAEKTVQAHKAYSADLFKDAEKNPENLLVVKNLKKYFPIKSSFFKMTVGNVKAVDGVSSSSRRAPPWASWASPAAASPPSAVPFSV